MATCQSCGAEVVFAEHVQTGKRAPLERKADGRFVLEPGRETYRAATAADDREGRPRYGNHYATCPQAAAWRSRARR